MILATFTKQPLEFKDYDVNYAPWLAPMGDTLDEIETTVVCVTDPADNSLVVDRTAMTASTLKLWVRGGTAGLRYKVTILAYTVGGRIDESELIFKVKDF